MNNEMGRFLARAREDFVAAQGSSVTLPGGAVLKAMIHHSDHDLLRSVRSEESGLDKRPVVLVFGGSAWGRVTEGTRVSIGTGTMLRTFIVGDPLHPKWRQDIVTELAVVAFPD